LDEPLAVIGAARLPEAVNTRLDRRDPGLFGRPAEATLGQKAFHQRLYRRFEPRWGATRDAEIVALSHQVDRGVVAALGFREVRAQVPLQAVQRQIG